MSFSAFSRARDNESIRFLLDLHEGHVKPMVSMASWRLLNIISAMAECVK